MNKTKYLIIILLTLVVESCKESPNTIGNTAEKQLFTAITSPAKTNSELPFLVANGHSTYLSWVAKEGDSLAILKYATLKDGNWEKTREIYRGTDWFVNWADYPMIAENNGNLWSHVLKKSTAGTYSYDVKMNVLPEGESTWRTDLALHSDATPTEHGFVSVLPYQDDFFVSWLDGRNTLEKEGEERGAMTLRAARVNAEGTVSEEHELDFRICDCCQTSAAMTRNGPVVLYRDRSDDELRDISIVRLIAGEWTKPKSIANDNWKIKGCPVNGPKAAAIGNNLALAWFTAAQQKPRVQLVFSKDGGASFEEAITVATGTVQGRVDVLLLDANTALISWMESQNKQTSLKAMKVTSNGTLSEAINIATLNGSRKSGFPQMELVGNEVYFAWTDVVKDVTQVKTGRIAVTNF